jgi:Mrp family chromosome partitioning ATPase/capsular polysaccharide biosynthesis protein
MTEIPSSSTPGIRHFLGVVRRQWWVILIVLALSIGAAVAYVQVKTPVYASSMKIAVGQGGIVLGPGISSDNVQSFTQTMTDLLESNVVADKVIKELDLNVSTQEFINNISVTTRPESSILDVRYEDTDRAQGTRILHEIGRTFTDLVNTTLGEQQAGQVPAAGAATDAQQARPLSANVFDPAHPVPGQVSPKTKLTIAVAAILGLVAGLILAFVRDTLLNRIRSDDEAHHAFEAPVIGALPRGAVGTKVDQIALLPPAAAARLSESLQLLSASVRFSDGRADSGVIVVTSANPEEGKTTLVTQLSSTIAGAGRTVIAVEGDLRKPSFRQFLDVRESDRGLTEYLAGDVDLEDALVDYVVAPARPALVGDGGPGAGDGQRGTPAGGAAANGKGGLRVLPAGRQTIHPSQLLSLGNAAQLVEQLKNRADYVIVDTPPILVTGDAFPLAQVADMVIVVCREGTTSREDARSIRRTLASLGIDDYSVVLTESKAAGMRTYGWLRRLQPPRREREAAPQPYAQPQLTKSRERAG